MSLLYLAQGKPDIILNLFFFLCSNNVQFHKWYHSGVKNHNNNNKYNASLPLVSNHTNSSIWYISIWPNIHYRQKYGMFYFCDFFFSFLWGVHVFLYLKYIPSSRNYFWESCFPLNSKIKHTGSKTITLVLFLYKTLVRRHVVPLRGCSIHVCMLNRGIMHNIIVYLMPNLRRSPGD